MSPDRCSRLTAGLLCSPRSTSRSLAVAVRKDVSAWLVGYAVDFYFHLGLVELRFYRSTGWAGFAEEGRVDFVHGREVLGVLEEHGALHYVGGCGAGCFQDAPDVFECQAHFVLNVAK